MELPDGRKFLATTNLWQTNLEFKTPASDTLVRFKTGGLVHLSAHVEFDSKAAAVQELALIIMLGWYIVVMLYSDSAGTTGSLAAIS